MYWIKDFSSEPTRKAPISKSTLQKQEKKNAEDKLLISIENQATFCRR